MLNGHLPIVSAFFIACAYYFTIPPQVQVEIASRKKIITDEHSGRILVDAALAEEEKEKMEALFKSFKAS